MKKIMMAGALLVFAASFSSCKKCIECSHPAYGDTDEYCGGDAFQRDIYKSGMEASGYNCN